MTTAEVKAMSLEELKAAAAKMSLEELEDLDDSMIIESRAMDRNKDINACQRMDARIRVLEDAIFAITG